MQDLTPKYNLQSAEEEIVVPDLFQSVPSQTVGGWQAGSSELKSGNVSIQATDERILLGNATEPLSGVGVFIGNDKAGGYDFRAGDPAGNYIHWDASAASLTIKGIIMATAGGTIGGWSISANAIYYDGATDAVSAGMAPADYPFYAGKKYADRATAPLRATPAGAFYCSSVEVTGKITAGAGSSVDFSYVAGTTKPANNATVNATFAQDAVPTSLAIGDFWVDTNDENKLYRAASAGADQITAGEWVLYRDTGIATAIQDAADAQSTADGKIITFAQDGVPTSTDIGDLWIDTNDGNKLYRAAIVGANEVKAGEWEVFRDTTIADAQATADGKIVSFFQTTVPTSVGAGDLWFDTDDGNKCYRATIAGADEVKAGEWVAAQDANKTTTFAQDAIPTSLAIGDLWIDTNDGNKLYRAASIGADQITAGEWILLTDTVVDDGTAPANPSGLTASAGIQSVFLKWTWNTETDMNYYDIYRHTADVQGSAVKIASVKVNMMFDSGLTAATPYYYWIKAVDRKGNASGFNASAGTTATPRNVSENDVLDDAITVNKINVANLAAISADLGNITAGTIVMPNTGYIRGGATDYATGIGFFLGYSGGAYKFSVGDPAGKYINWTGSDFVVNGFMVSSKGAFGGDGSDGALAITNGTTTINVGAVSVYIKNYSSISITGTTGKLAFSNPASGGTILIFKSSGGVTLTSTNNPLIDLTAMGGVLGTGGGASGDNNYGSQGGGGASAYNAGSAGDNGGTNSSGTVGSSGSAFGGIFWGSITGGGGGTKNVAGTAGGTPSYKLAYSKYAKLYVLPGSGGGGGQAGNGVAGSNGGAGAGALFIECAGALNGTGIILAQGSNGVNEVDKGGAGGGGGSGSVVILYNTLTANSLTITTTASTGGTGASGNGGAGAAGGSLVTQNTEYA